MYLKIKQIIVFVITIFFSSIVYGEVYVDEITEDTVVRTKLREVVLLI